MPRRVRVLVVEDVEDDYLLLIRALERGGISAEHARVETGDEMRAAIEAGDWDVVISDYALPHFSGGAALDLVKRHRADLPFIVVSGTIGDERAAEMIRRGASDFLLKTRLGRVAHAVEQALSMRAEQMERRRAEEALRRSEEQLLQAQKMEAVGRLAGGVAHDFNNLLTVITGYGDLARRRAGSDELLQRYLDEIFTASERAAALTRQLLAFSRKQILQPKVFDLHVVIRNLLTMLERLIGEDIDLTTALCAGPAPVRADPGQVEQVIVNLAVNARDAMPTGGRLTISTSVGELPRGADPNADSGAPGCYVVLSVRDTGSGMTADVLGRIFEPFFTTKESGKGTGLGLSTVYGIVRQSGGDVRVESEPGRGTRFDVYLPRADGSSEEAGPGAVAAASTGGSETVLLVEDEEGVRRLVGSVLRSRGYTLLEAADGAGGIRIASGHEGPVHLLVTDVVMPRTSGRELAEQLTAARPEMRVLYMSGYTDDALSPHATFDERDFFLGKPFTPDALARAVREALDAPG